VIMQANWMSFHIPSTVHPTCSGSGAVRQLGENEVVPNHARTWGVIDKEEHVPRVLVNHSQKFKQCRDRTRIAVHVREMTSRNDRNWWAECSSGNMLHMNSGSFCYGYQSGHRVFWLRLFRGFNQSLQEIFGLVLGHESFFQILLS
jgi:hypothetical protein